ncbi:IS607 family element RNA-guided endonuclease TnpB [Nocardia wallacei]|uniref:IS607 family element RNA-guided endonuclease TnpB n=1 Tax=Nocardia wallacei TaxID=480035 RepID=UPI002458D0B5|nr:IS607 family element RNA-guided endonuclease TnpB [Nocardia wallacei]
MSVPDVMIWAMGGTAAKCEEPDGWVVRAYRFALDPSPAQEQMLRSHCGAQRFAYNWGLAVIKANVGQRAAERSYEIPEELMTPPVPWDAYGMRRSWNRAKDSIAPWWRENSKEAYASGLANLAAALNNWARSRDGDRAGERMRFPRFKSKKCALSCRFTTGAFGLTASDRRHVKLPRIGPVRTHESTRKLARRIEAGAARIRSATVTHRRDRWFVSFSVEVRYAQLPPVRPDAVVGVDLGVKYLAVLSCPVLGVSDDRGMVANPAHLERAQRKLRRLQRRAARRRGPDRRGSATPSRRWRRANATVTKLHARVANCREDGLHRLTNALTDRFGVIVVEDLNVAGMLRNRRLARRIAGAGWGELRRQLAYKTGRRGGRLVVADRWYPSSKLCSVCGAVKTKLRLSHRVYHCEVCGFRADRDRNAARNLAALAARTVNHDTSSPSRGATLNEPAGNPRKTGIAGGGYCHGKPHEGNVECASTRLSSNVNHALDGNGSNPSALGLSLCIGEFAEDS